MSRQDQIRANKRNQFQQRRQVNQLYAQRLNQGMTPGQAATTPYTVTDSDTLESVASANGVDVTNVLAANPDMKSLQTGMVINVPGSEAWRAQGYGGMSGGIGLPSNAALGGTTNNPQGRNRFDTRGNAPEFRNSGTNAKELFETPAVRNIPSVGMNIPTPGEAWRGILNWSPNRTGNAPTIPQEYNPGTPVRNIPALGSNYSRSQAVKNYVNAAPAVLGKDEQVSPWQNPYSNGYFVAPSNPAAARPPTNTPGTPGAFNAAINAITQSLGNPQQIQQTAAPFGQGYQYMSRNLYHQQIRTKVDTAGYMPTPGELNILETMGFIKKDKTSVGGGGYGRKRGRGGGGGGGKNLGGGGGVPREPAFAGGSGFGGLVNWRI
jgi:LysM repeat protein